MQDLSDHCAVHTFNTIKLMKVILTEASGVLNKDSVLRHIVLTECKLASGEWIDVLSLACLPLTSLEESRMDLSELLGVTDRRETRNYMSVANALAVINQRPSPIGTMEESEETI